MSKYKRSAQTVDSDQQNNQMIPEDNSLEDVEITFDSDDEPNYDEIAMRILQEYKKRKLRKKVNDIEYEVINPKSKANSRNQKRNDQKKSKHISPQFQHTSRNDMIEITVIVLLILILGVSLFRVILEVQNQYKKADHANSIRSNEVVTDFRSKNTNNYNNLQYLSRNQENTRSQKRFQNPSSKNKAIIISQSSSSEVSSMRSNNNNVNSVVVKSAQVGERPKKQPQIVITLLPQCQRYINNLLAEKGSLYQFRYPYNELYLKSRVDKHGGSRASNVQQTQYGRAVNLVTLIHHFNNQGQVVVQENPCENKEQAIARLKKALEEEKHYYEEKYKISQYMDKQLRFCIVSNSYMNAKKGLLYRNIDSVLQQQYSNFHVVYTDDHSDDNTGNIVIEYLKSRGVSQSLYKVKINQNKKGMMQNIYNAITNDCNDGEIAVMLDGDDSFIGRQVLSLMNAVYHREKKAIIWTNFVSVFGNSQINMGFSRGYNQRQIESHSYRKMKAFISSHLKTFFVDLFKKIKIEDLQENDGKFYGGASDTVMMIAMLELASPKVLYIPQLTYQYRFDTGLTGNSVNRGPQKSALKKLYESTPYEPLTDFQFLYDALERAQRYKQTMQKAQVHQID